MPNWTWATFEHKDNPGRCDVIGCSDHFGAAVPYAAPLSPIELKTHYPDCAKSSELVALFLKAKIDPAFVNYCLKGAQPDFTDTTGLAIRLGNSVTEQGFVSQASCMTCHGRAAFDATGHATSFAGFDPISNNIPLGPQNTGNGTVGPINSAWYWVAGGPPSFPSSAERTGHYSRRRSRGFRVVGAVLCHRRHESSLGNQVTLLFGKIGTVRWEVYRSTRLQPDGISRSCGRKRPL